MNGGTTKTKTGDEAIKTGKLPSPLKTVLLAVRLIFFSDKALYSIFLNSKHNLNIFCLYAVMLLIPYRDFNGDVSPDGFGGVLESFTLTAIFICLLFMYMPKKQAIFMGFVRLMLAFELTDVIVPFTFMLKKQYLHIFHPLFMAWYLSLVVFAVSKIKGSGYAYSFVLVFGSFLFVMLLPSFF